jgi:cytochrome c oxidase subunit IV
MSEQAMSEHVMPSRQYYIIWIVLLILTGVTAGVSFIDLGQFNTVVALAIATFKAVLVVLFFMHVLHAGEKLIKLVVIAAVFWLSLLLCLSMMDYLTRHLL